MKSLALASQTITFNPLADTPLGETVSINASASSGLPVTFTVETPSVCNFFSIPVVIFPFPLSNLGNTGVQGTPGVRAGRVDPSAPLTLNNEGTCTITAKQDGDSANAPAPPVTRSFVVRPVPPDAPEAASATAGVSSIAVTWQAPADNEVAITGYTAVASPGPSTCTTTGATSCVMGGVAGVSYTVTVIAHAAGGNNSRPSEPSNAVIPGAPPVLSQPPATDLTLTTDKGPITTANPGQDIVFIGTGFAPNSTVTITMYSTPTVLGSVVTDASGGFRKSITVPANLAAGGHTAVAQGVAPDGTNRAMKLSITVATQANTLPITGVALTTLVLVAVALTVTGVVLTRVGRRRRAADTVFTAV